MMSFRALLAAAPLLALAVAQNIAFTSTPAEVVAGQSYNITWGGGDGSGATITLRQGNPQDLHTVSTIADAVTTGYYVWTVPSSLESGDDYAFQITQGQSDINYSGLFSVSGGSASSSTISGNMTASTTGAVSATMIGNSTASITSVSGALGTGTAAGRNTTFSSATLSSTDSSTDSSAASSTQNFNSMTTTTHSSATRTPSSASASTSAPSNDAPIRAGSSAALILGIVAAVMLH